jgi:anti-anti-sigma regulatory factor
MLLDNELNEKKYKVLIVDCVSVQFIDEAGFKCLKEMINEYEKENIKFLLTNCNGKYCLL